MQRGDTHETCPVIKEAGDLFPSASIWVDRMHERRLHSLFRYSADSEDLSGCESLKLSQSDVSNWASRFSEMESLRELELYRIDQTSFETVCLAPNLERLRVIGSQVSNLSSLPSLRKLTHLCLDNGSKVGSLEPLQELPALSALALNRPFLSSGDLGPLENCTGLKGLRLYSTKGYGKGNAFNSLSPLRFLDKLRVLWIGAPIADGSIDPVLNLRKLDYLWLDRWNQWSREDYQALNEKLTNLVASTAVKLAATDKEFCKRHRIRSIG